MEEKIKEIVSTFTRLPADQIGPATPIGRAAIKSSILLHRMFAKLSEAGVKVDNYSEVKVYGDLFAGGRQMSSGSGQEAVEVPMAAVPVAVGGKTEGVGIDIEEIAAMPRANDFRRDEFYSMNFTAGEIAYCILQPDPYSSFAGLFAVKEAIVKADGSYASRQFNSIGIGHSPEGRPVHPGFSLSISHAGSMAVAVAVPERGMVPQEPAAVPTGQNIAGTGRAGASWTGWLAIVLSIAAIIIHFIR